MWFFNSAECRERTAWQKLLVGQVLDAPEASETTPQTGSLDCNLLSSNTVRPRPLIFMALLPSHLPDELPVLCSRHCSLPAAAGSPSNSLPASLLAGAGISQASLATQHNLSVPYPPKPSHVKHPPFDHKFTFWIRKRLVWSKPARVIPP